MSNEKENLPANILAAAASAKNSLLPERSEQIYTNCYEQFVQWQEKNKVSTFEEDVFLAYFNTLSETKKPSPLWSTFSMMKKMIIIKHNLDIAKYNLLVAFLQRKSDGFRSKKSEILTSEQIDTFLKTAPDYKYLSTKVALIFGICGALRSCELCHITMDNVEKQGDILLVKIPFTKNKVPRSFVIDGDFREIVRKYEALRPKKCSTNRFFVTYNNGKCMNQPTGKNKIGNLPFQIAEFLGLPDPKKYTGHSFRRTSATLLADAGADVTTLKRHGGWKSSTVAEGYIAESLSHKKKVGKQIQEECKSSH